MKYLFIAFIAVCSIAMPQQVQAQQDAITKYFEQYMDDESFTVVYVSPKMFEIFARLSDDTDQDVKNVIKDLKGLRILTKDKDGLKYYKEATKKISLNGYEELMTIRDDGQNVKFMTKEKDGVINELLLIVGGADEFVLMSFIGKINLDKIAKLSKSVDIDGLNHLEKMEKQ